MAGYGAAMVQTVVTLVIGAVVGGVVGSVVEATTGWVGRWIGAKKAERLRLRYGDHTAINSGFGASIDSGGGDSFRVGVEVAPSVSLAAGGSMDSYAASRVADSAQPGLSTRRQHHDPSDLIRFIDGPTVLTINNHGCIALLAPVAHVAEGTGSSERLRLDLDDLIRVVAPFVAMISDAGLTSIYGARLVNSRVDWRFSVSPSMSGTTGTVTWRGIKFSGRPPREETLDQAPPRAGELGFGGEALRNIDITSAPADVMMRAIESLIERDGYLGLDDCMIDLRASVKASVTKA